MAPIDNPAVVSEEGLIKGPAAVTNLWKSFRKTDTRSPMVSAFRVLRGLVWESKEESGMPGTYATTSADSVPVSRRTNFGGRGDSFRGASISLTRAIFAYSFRTTSFSRMRDSLTTAIG